MAKKAHYLTHFEAGRFYHVYNRTVDKKPMFKTTRNYEFFLKKYDHYLSPVLDTYAYNLLGNHFHLMVRIKSYLELATFKKLPTLDALTTHQIVSHQFQKFFQSYAMAFNKQENRTGALFQEPFKRALIDNDAYFTRLVFYIHTNASHHNLVENFRDWSWSSYGRIMIEKPSRLMKKEVLDWFGGNEQYLVFHSDNSLGKPNPDIIAEDD
jgi:putative transposase